MAKCQWKDECYTPAHGGEFYCLTHLQESDDTRRWIFRNAGDPPEVKTRPYVESSAQTPEKP